MEPFFADVKLALTTGITLAFLWGAVLMSLAFVAMFFVREIPLFASCASTRPAEIGVELLAEESVQPGEHEPVIVGDAPEE